MATTITININNQGQQQTYSPYPASVAAAPAYIPGYYVPTAPQQRQIPVKTFFVAGLTFLVFSGGFYFFSNPFKMLVRIARMIPISYNNQAPSRQYSEQFDSTSAESDYPEYFPPAQRQESLEQPSRVPTTPAPAIQTSPKLGVPIQKKTGAVKFTGEWAAPAKKGEKIAGYRISSIFGRRIAPVPGASTFHRGTDVAAPKGTPLYPIVLPGEETSVRCWNDSGGGGNVATFVGAGHEFQYLHLSHCKPGKAKAGDKIANVGDSGIGSGAHLHIERKEFPGSKKKVPVERGFVRWSLEGKSPQ